MITIPPELDESPGLEIDPRMHQRRVDVRREHTRRRARMIIAAGTVVVLAAAVFLGLHSPLASAHRLTVTGTGQVSEAEVLHAGGIGQGEPLVDISAAAAVRGIEALPWVERATVSKSWPSGVRVAVTERRAVAQVPLGTSATGPVALVDATGRVLDHQAGLASGIPVITGAGSPPAAGKWMPGTAGAAAADGRATSRANLHRPRSPFAAALALAWSFQTVGLGPGGKGVGPQHLYIGRIELSDGSLGALVRPDQSTIEIGADTDLGPKVNAILAMLTNVALAAGSTVDVSTPDNPTVARPGAIASV